MKARRIRRSVAIVLSMGFTLSVSGGLSGEGHSPEQDNTKERPDPCEQSVTAPGLANGLDRRCEPLGSGGASKGDFNAIASGDHSGSALAAGDFNGDGVSDLAIGVPDRNVGSAVNAGRVLLIDGSPNGLDPATARTLSLIDDKRGRAGAALVWADFDGDSFGDLAVGIPNATIVTPISSFFGICGRQTAEAGEVQVFYGSVFGSRRREKNEDHGQTRARYRRFPWNRAGHRPGAG